MTVNDEGRDLRAAKLAALLRATDPPARAPAFPGERIAHARRRRTVMRRLGAVALVLLLGAALVPPVRAWIVGAARHLFAGASAGQPAPEARRPGFAASPNRAAFATNGDLFVVSVATRQTAGALRFERSADAAVHAALTGDPAEAALVVLPSGLRIVNGSRVRQDYVVRLPVSVTHVQVRVGDEPAREVPLDADGRAIVSVSSESTGTGRSNR